MKKIGVTWKDVPGYDGRYQASDEGQVRHVWPSGLTTMLKAYVHPRRGHSIGDRYVKLTKDGISKEIRLARVIAETFLGGVPDGMAVYHKDGFKGNNELCNLRIMTRREIGLITGKLCAPRIVMKVAADGEVLDFYRSTRLAGEANGMSYQAVCDRIHGRVKHPLALNGFTFRYEE